MDSVKGPGAPLNQPKPRSAEPGRGTDRKHEPSGEFAKTLHRARMIQHGQNLHARKQPHPTLPHTDRPSEYWMG
jgi:hypothetical protein